MSMFTFSPQHTLTGITSGDLQRTPRGAVIKGVRSSDALWDEEHEPSFVRDDGIAPSKDDLQDQFVVFQLNNEQEGPAILNAEAVTSQLEGSEDQPDVLARLNLISFHVGAHDTVKENTRATMRINFGKDPSSSDRAFDTAFWAVAAGLKLYNESTGKPAENKELAADMNRAFGNRPIEIPGGLGNLSFEVIKHEEPKWWQRTFRFLQGSAGQALTSVLGFPAITQSAINIIDELVGRLEKDDPEILFKSAPMRLALTQRAHDEFTGGSRRIRLGSLNPGYCILARYRDYKAFAESDAVFYPSLGLLAPSDADPTVVANLTRDNPLNDLTYAVFRVRMKSAQLDPSFNFKG